jgi:hypothetical protein
MIVCNVPFNVHWKPISRARVCDHNHILAAARSFVYVLHMAVPQGVTPHNQPRFGMFGPWWQVQGGVEKYIAHIPNMDLSLSLCFTLKEQAISSAKSSPLQP